jgi:enterochelin esterase-like enzyme/outer membrane protein assembly factor BamB
MRSTPCRPDRRPLFPLALALALALGGPALGAADWPSWLGPTRDGRATGLGVEPGKPVGFEVAWKRALGKGYTGIAVSGERAVTMFADGTKDWVVAFEARTGQELWRYEIDAMYPPQGGSEGGPAGMPVVADGVVYGLGAKGHLFAVQLADGRELWKLRIDEALGGRPPMFGFSTAPLVAGDVLFVQTGGDAGRGLTGFDRRTGQVLWSTGDDPAGYASPLLATLADVEQVVALTNRALYGLEPATGRVLWSREHGMVQGGDAIGTPVLIGDDRFFVNGEPESKAFAVRKDGETWQVEVAWNTRDLEGSFATPVFHDDHLYGFDGDFLTCIRTVDGTKVWKSRPPGGRGLVLVDGHLLILANDGAMVAVPATPEGYREAGRLPAMGAGTWTYPSFAGGLILVRNTVEVAAIAVRSAPAAAPVPAAASGGAGGAFAHFVERVDRSESKRLLVDEYMRRQISFPVVEEGWVHFLYRGPAEDVAITGSMTAWMVEEPLSRLEGTDLLYRSYESPPATRWEYRFNVDFENPQPDPLNPRRVPGRDGDMSEVTTGGFTRSAWLEPWTGAARGSIESFTLASEILRNERSVDVWLPPGYGVGGERYPLVVVVDGGIWRSLGHLPNVLDHVAASAAPVVVALVHQPQGARAEFGARADDYVRMLAEEAVPAIEGRYRTLARSDARATLGAGSGATLAALAALAHPAVFGKAAVTSAFVGPSADKLAGLAEGLAAGSPKPVFEVTWSRHDLRNPERSADIARDTRQLAETLERHGFTVRAREAADSSGWGGWPVRAGEMLVALFPRP